MKQDQRQLALVKGESTYVFRYPQGREASVLDAFVALANDANSEFDWFDAAVLSYQLSREVATGTETVFAPTAMLPAELDLRDWDPLEEEPF